MEVYQHPGFDQALDERQRVNRERARRFLLVSGPFLLLALALSLLRLVRDAEGDAVLVGGAALFTVALIAGLTIWLLRRQQRRGATVDGRLWQSRFASFLGPYDDDERGLTGSAEFARRHRANAANPIVLLVLTSTAIAVVPTRGRNEPLTIPLSDIATVRISHGKASERGLSITTRDGPEAAFLVRPDDQLVVELRHLGATVSGGESPS